MKKSDFYYPEDYNGRYRMINDKTYEAFDREDISEVYKRTFDIAYRFLMNGYYKWYEERYEGEAREVCCALGEFAFTHQYLRNYINNWAYYIRNRIPAFLYVHREITYNHITDELNNMIQDDPEAKYAMLEASGMKDYSSYEYRILDNISDIKYLKYEKVLDYVMRKYCIYKKGTLEYKYLNLSMMMTIYRGCIVYYRIDKHLKNSLLLLVNQYNRLISQVNKDGVILVK